MSKVNRFMSPVQTQYQQTYVSQFVPLPFELMQKKADRQQEKFDTVKTFTDELMQNLVNEVDISDQAVQQSEIYGIQNQINKALEQVDGDYSKIGGIVSKAATEWNNYKNTDEGYLMRKNKEGIDANIAEIYGSNMEAVDILAAMNSGVNYYRNNTDKAVGGVSFTPSTIYDNPDDLQKQLLDHADKLKLSNENGSVSSYSYFINKQGNFVIENNDRNTKTVSVKRIKDDFKGTVYGNEKWRKKTEWQYDHYSQLGLLEGITDAEGNPIDNLKSFRDMKFSQMMSESLNYNASAISRTDEQKDVNIRQAVQDGANSAANLNNSIAIEKNVNLQDNNDNGPGSKGHYASDGISKWNNYGKYTISTFVNKTLKELGINQSKVNLLYDVYGVPKSEGFLGTGIGSEYVLDEKTYDNLLTNIITNPSKLEEVLTSTDANASMSNEVRSRIINEAISIKGNIRKASKDLQRTTEEYFEYHDNKDVTSEDFENYNLFKSYMRNEEETIERFLQLPMLEPNDRKLAKSIYGKLSKYTDLSDSERSKLNKELDNIARQGLKYDDNFLNANEGSSFTRGFFGEKVGIGWATRTSVPVDDLMKSVVKVKTVQQSDEFTDFVTEKIENNKDAYSSVEFTSQADMLVSGEVQKNNVNKELSKLQKAFYEKPDLLYNVKVGDKGNTLLTQLAMDKENRNSVEWYALTSPQRIKIENEVKEEIKESLKGKQPFLLGTSKSSKGGDLVLYNGIPIEINTKDGLRFPKFGESFTAKFNTQRMINQRLIKATSNQVSAKKEIYPNVFINTEVRNEGSDGKKITSFLHLIKDPVTFKTKVVDPSEFVMLANVIESFYVQDKNTKGKYVTYKEQSMHIKNAIKQATIDFLDLTKTNNNAR